MSFKIHSIYLSSTYALYCAILCLIFDPFQFISESNHVKELAIFSVIVFILSAILLRAFSNHVKPKKNHIILIIGTYFIPSISAAIIASAFSTFNPIDLVLYFSSFLIFPILPIAVYVLYVLYLDLISKVSREAKQSNPENLPAEKFFALKNEKRKSIIEVSVNRIIAFEANDNYVVSYYLDENEKLQKSMQRISLRKIEGMISEQSSNFHRVHKSYLINLTYISEIRGKSQAYKLEVEFLPSTIPVSRSFDISILGLH